MKYDVLVIGAGPAGLTAGIFCRRAGLNVLCLESIAVGGQASLSVSVDNYPGFNLVSGFELTSKIHAHATSFGVQIKYGTVTHLKKGKTGFVVETSSTKYEADKVIIACGCKVRKLGLENEQKLTGRGVSYCASCDGNFFKNKVVAVVGGGRTAEEDVTYLTKIAKKIYLINRRVVIRAGTHALEEMKRLKNVDIIAPAVVTHLHGSDKLEEITINHNGKEKKLKVDGIFIAIGSEPVLDFLEIDVKKDEKGYIITDSEMRTSVKSLYAAGDIVSKNFRQIINACAEGATAGNSCVGDR